MPINIADSRLSVRKKGGYPTLQNYGLTNLQDPGNNDTLKLDG